MCRAATLSEGACGGRTTGDLDRVRDSLGPGWPNRPDWPGGNCVIGSEANPVADAVCRSVRSSLQLYFCTTPAVQPQTIVCTVLLLASWLPRQCSSATTAQGCCSLPHLTRSKSEGRRSRYLSPRTVRDRLQFGLGVCVWREEIAWRTGVAAGI